MIHSMTSEEIKEYLVSDSLLDDEVNIRFNLLQKEINETVRQHNALVEVYQENLHKGTQAILSTINPQKLETEIAKEAMMIGPFLIPYRLLIPFYVRTRLNRQLKQIIYEMLMEDKERLTEKYFGLYM